MTDRSRSLIGIAGLLIALLGTGAPAEASPRVRQEGLTSRDGRLQSRHRRRRASHLRGPQ